MDTRTHYTDSPAPGHHPQSRPGLRQLEEPVSALQRKQQVWLFG